MGDCPPLRARSAMFDSSLHCRMNENIFFVISLYVHITITPGTRLICQKGLLPLIFKAPVFLFLKLVFF